MMLDHHIKSGPGAASVRGLRPEMAVAWTIVVAVFERHDCVARLSSGTDGQHVRGSSHYRGEAIDISKKGVPAAVHPSLGVAMSDALGDEFDVIEESTHWHIQFKPKEPLNHG